MRSSALPHYTPEKTTASRPAPSKMRPPAIGSPFVARERLIERMHKADGVKLVVVDAPAGFGKTTLLRHLYDVSLAGGAVAWLTLDAGDNDLDRFMTCLAQAFATLQPFGLSEYSPAAIHRDFDLVQAITSAPLPFILILDEFEHLHNPAALTVIQQLIDMLAPQQRIVIGSREQPALSLARLRMRQQLLEIGTEQLRFSLAETDEFLCEKRRLKLDRHDVEHFHELTGGWAAALWLSSLALENHDDPKRFIDNFSGCSSVVSSYLAEDVLSHRPQHVQDFILQTSILHKFCADSCNAVTGRRDSDALIREIERSNMFITALDEQHNWFTYHPLFAGFLRAQLVRRHPGLATTLHQRAANWYVEQNLPTHAIEHAIAAGETGLILTLLDRHAQALFLQGRVRMLTRWFDALERSNLAPYPKLISVYAWSLIHTNRSEEALSLLESLTNPDGDASDAASCIASCITSNIASNIVSQVTSRMASRMPSRTASISHPTYLVLKTFSLVMLDRIEQTAPMWEDPHILGSAASEPLLRSMLMIGCAYYYATIGRYQEARLLLDQATREHSAVGPLFSVAVAGYVHAMLDILQGRLRTAGARLRAVIGDDPHVRLRSTGPRLRALIGADTDSSNPRYGADTGFASLYLAEVLYESDQLEEAKHLLTLYLPLVKDAGIPDQLVSSHVILARILRAQGNAGNNNDALQRLLELEQLGMQRNLPRVVDIARLERARCALLDGDMETARSLQALVGTSPCWKHKGVQMVANDLESPMLSYLRLQIHCGQAAHTLPVFKEHLQDAYARGRQRYALRVKVLYALALSHAGQRNPALRTMRETLQEAQAEGFVRLFKEEGPALLALIRDMLETMKDLSNTEHAALYHFAAAIHAPFIRQAAPAEPGQSPAALPADCDLTEREFDVLQLLAQGCGNQAIADKLFVSITTVKTHLRNINLKLGAHNRTEAISIARKRSIIV